MVGLPLRPGIDGIGGVGRDAVARAYRDRYRPRRRVVGVGVAGLRRNTRCANEFTDAGVGLVAEPDAVDQATGDGVVAQQRRLVGERVDLIGCQVARLGDRLPHLAVQAFDQPAVGLAVGVGVAVLCEKVCRGLVFAASDELRLDAGLVQRVAQEQRVGGETDQPDGARRLHPHLAERRRQVVRQRAGVGLGPRQRRLDIAEGGDGRRAAPAPDPPQRPGAEPGQSARPPASPRRRGGWRRRLRAAAVACRRWRSSRADRSRRPPCGTACKIQFEHTPARDAVVPGGVDPPDRDCVRRRCRGCRTGKQTCFERTDAQPAGPQASG